VVPCLFQSEQFGIVPAISCIRTGDYSVCQCALPSILNANNLPVSNPLSMAEIIGQLGRSNGAVPFQQLKPVVPLQAFQELEFCLGCVTKLHVHVDCLNLWCLGMSLRQSANVVWTASGHCFSSSLQTIPAQFQELLCACPLRLVFRDFDLS
jgi:hypothetical protein